MSLRKVLNLIERTNLIPFIGRIWDAVSKVEDFHILVAYCSFLVAGCRVLDSG
jgi:hypothetical protein